MILRRSVKWRVAEISSWLQGGEQTFTVQPKLGLSAKDDPYVEELVFASDESTEASATVTASVMVRQKHQKQLLQQ